MKKMNYRSRIQLPQAEADFVCALARMIEINDKVETSPEDVICGMIRMYARQLGPDFTKKIWNQAKKDGKGPWK